LQAVYTDIRALGAELVVISPELPSYLSELAGKQVLTFPLLHDYGCAVASAFGIAWTFPDDLKDLYLNTFKNDLAVRNGEGSWKLPMPARYVIDKAGVIRAADVDPDYTVRPEPEATLSVLRLL